MKKFLPIILLFRDKTLDLDGHKSLILPGLYIAKGRTLTLKNLGVDQDLHPILTMTTRFFRRIKGNVRLARKPIEMTKTELLEFVAVNHEKPNEEMQDMMTRHANAEALKEIEKYENKNGENMAQN